MFKNNSVIIIGDSPYLGEIEGYMNYLVEMYPSIGINWIIEKYPINTHIFQDLKFIEVTNRYPDVKTVAPAMYGDMVQKTNKELIDSYTYNFKSNSEGDLYKDNKLAWCGFTHDYAISYAIHKGYTNIILVGAADFISGGHYATDEDFLYAEKLKLQSKKFIEEVASKRVHILTCNFNSVLEIPRVTMQELLK